MDVPYFIKEHLWMRAFDEAIPKKVLVEINSPQSWPWKQNDNSCDCCDDSWNYEQLEKRVSDKYFDKKLDFES